MLEQSRESSTLLHLIVRPLVHSDSPLASPVVVIPSTISLEQSPPRSALQHARNLPEAGAERTEGGDRRRRHHGPGPGADARAVRDRLRPVRGPRGDRAPGRRRRRPLPQRVPHPGPARPPRPVRRHLDPAGAHGRLVARRHPQRGQRGRGLHHQTGAWLPADHHGPAAGRQEHVRQGTGQVQDPCGKEGRRRRSVRRQCQYQVGHRRDCHGQSPRWRRWSPQRRPQRDVAAREREATGLLQRRGSRL